MPTTPIDRSFLAELVKAVDRAGADHLELAEHATGELRRRAAVVASQAGQVRGEVADDGRAHDRDAAHGRRAPLDQVGLRAVLADLVAEALPGEQPDHDRLVQRLAVDEHPVARVAALDGLAADGDLGPQTIKALQERVGVTQDGNWGAQTSAATQERLNAGTLDSGN